jgi:methylated-DNA-[protein]-cysteine S-methyltransferase
MTTLELYEDALDTPIGTATLLCDRDGKVRALDWADHSERLRRLLERHYGRDGYRLRPATSPSKAWRALTAYFDGDLHALHELPVATIGTVFQREVWSALRTIPPGRTLSYCELALAIGRPSAARAVGLANGANPIAIIVPCHRVIGANRNLTGYAGGLERKRWLLHHEQRLLERRNG